MAEPEPEEMAASAGEGRGTGGSPAEGGEQSKSVTRLSFKGRPGEEGYARRVRIMEAMMEYSPSTIFGTKGKGKAYKEVVELLNRDSVFHDSLKESTLREKWCEVMKVVDRILVGGEENYIQNLEAEGKRFTKLDDLYFILARRKAKWADAGGARGDSDGDDADGRVAYATAIRKGTDKRRSENDGELTEPKISVQDTHQGGETESSVTRVEASLVRWESALSSQRDRAEPEVHAGDVSDGGCRPVDKERLGKTYKRTKLSRESETLLSHMETQRLQAEAEKIKAEAAKAQAEAERYNAQTARIVALKDQNDSIARVLQAFVSSVKEGVTLPAGVLDMLSSIKPDRALDDHET
eukprot:323741-Hanusia_phi.AAC.2